MSRVSSVAVIFLAGILSAHPQSGRVTGYSESGATRLSRETKTQQTSNTSKTDPDVVRVPTNLVTIPVRITTPGGKAVSSVRRDEFKVFENGVEQEIAYFSNDEQPFTVVLLLDMSYSSVFRLEDIQLAARIFVAKLRDHDRVMVVSFDEKPHILCEATNDRRILGLAIGGASIASGTALYDTLGMLIRDKLSTVSGRRAVVLLSDGVDTSSQSSDAKTVEKRFGAEDVIVYPIVYDTFDDVQKNRKNNAEIRFDENDRPYIAPSPLKKGERLQDYEAARAFLKTISDQTGGSVYRVSSTTKLNDAFTKIADELRRVYSLGYYPPEDRKSGATYDIKVRVYRPDLKITARNHYLGK